MPLCSCIIRVLYVSCLRDLLPHDLILFHVVDGFHAFCCRSTAFVAAGFTVTIDPEGREASRFTLSRVASSAAVWKNSDARARKLPLIDHQRWETRRLVHVEVEICVLNGTSLIDGGKFLKFIYIFRSDVCNVSTLQRWEELEKIPFYPARFSKYLHVRKPILNHINHFLRWYLGRQKHSYVRYIKIIDSLNSNPNWPYFKVRNPTLSTLSFFLNFFSKDVFTLCSRWKSKDDFIIENLKNSNYWTIFFVIRSTIVLKIEVYPLHQLLKTCCMILFRHFNIRVKQHNSKNPDLLSFNLNV